MRFHLDKKNSFQDAFSGTKNHIVTPIFGHVRTWFGHIFFAYVDIKMFFSHTRLAPAKSGVGIGVPEFPTAHNRVSGFFMR